MLDKFEIRAEDEMEMIKNKKDPGWTWSFGVHSEDCGNWSRDCLERVGQGSTEEAAGPREARALAEPIFRLQKDEGRPTWFKVEQE